MRTYVRTTWMALFLLLVAGCSRPTETAPEQKKSMEAPASQPAITAPAETAPTPTPPAAAPAPRPRKEQPKPKPAAAARPAVTEPAVAPAPVAQPVPAQPQLKTLPTGAETDRPAPAPIVRRVTLPAGTSIPLRMIDSVDSKTDQVGQTFRASIDSDIEIEGQTLVPKGADARLKLNRVSSAGKVRGRSELALQLDQIVVGNKKYAVVTNVIERAGEAEGKKTARDVAIGGAVGAAIGAIAGGKKGAAIGAGVGAGSGAAVAVMTKGEQVVVPSETQLEFRLEQPLEIEVRVSPTH